MREVTPESIAYLLTQVSYFFVLALQCSSLPSLQIYFSLCCLELWGGYFNLEQFYNVCLKLFTADPGDELEAPQLAKVEVINVAGINSVLVLLFHLLLILCHYLIA